LKVSRLGEEVRARHMDWLHLPIRDVSVPDAAFEANWEHAGEAIRARLRAGFDVLVHCKGGLGRAGTIAARLLAELGWDADEAIFAVRAVRHGAIETLAQQRHVLSVTPVDEPVPSREPTAIRDRALGALLGLAIGDALGTTLEFSRRDSSPPLSDIVGGGPFGLKPGEWTDDTAMALALGHSLLAQPHLDEHDLMTRFCAWWRQGEYSCTGTCFDVGVTTATALRKFERTGDPIAGSSDPATAGNGALMRLAPVALRHWQDRDKLTDIAIRQSATTHAAPEALSASAAFAQVLADAIAGESRSRVLRSRTKPHAGRIAAIMGGSWRGKRRDEVRSSGYVAHSLEAALWCVGRTSDFASAVLLAANLGEDADTTAAITGQLAGALYGRAGIPPVWLDMLAGREEIEAVGERLISAGKADLGNDGTA
jgi:ADP-ribosyl-[dinitrogen reductase] hydrolase